MAHIKLSFIEGVVFEFKTDLCFGLKVSIQGVVALGGHFATLCKELDFYEAIFFFIINFQKEKANTLTLLIILIVKSLQIELHSTNLLHSCSFIIPLLIFGCKPS